MVKDAKEIVARGLHRRAIEAVIWGMPAVNYDLLYQSMVRAKGGWNQIVYWSRPPDWKNQTLTPNLGRPVFLPFHQHEGRRTRRARDSAGRRGRSITGSVDDAWQTAIEDVGPAGVDKGKGGRYLILPPDYKDDVPAGYVPMPSPTYQSYGILRSNPASGNAADVAKAVGYGKQVKVYPLSAAAKPAATVFVDANESEIRCGRIADASSLAPDPPMRTQRQTGCPPPTISLRWSRAHLVPAEPLLSGAYKLPNVQRA